MGRLLLLLAAALCLVAPAIGIDAPCSACAAVASQLQKRLDAEKPRNHLDLRHRLDKHGKRYGKVIAYKLSELRAVELLDDLCDDAGNAHVLVTVDDITMDAAAHQGGDDAAASKEGGRKKGRRSFKIWARVSGDSLIDDLGAKRIHEAETHQKRSLTTFCGGLVDKHEDEIVAALKNDDFGTEEGVAPVLCERIAKRCQEEEIANTEDRLDAIVERRKSPPTPPPTPAPSDGEAAAEGADGGGVEGDGKAEDASEAAAGAADAEGDADVAESSSEEKAEL